MSSRVSLVTFCLALPAIAIGSAQASQIHTGGTNGAYYSVFCPRLKAQLETFGSPHECATSAGTPTNVRRVARNPRHFGFGQLDAFALESRAYGGTGRFSIVRSGDVRECVFAVTRNKALTNYGQIAVDADRLRFVLPPKRSGSARTFKFLQGLDPEGLGRAKTVSHAQDTDDAIRAALADDTAVTFFVQFPDPENERFQMVRRLGGHIVPVLDGLLLLQKISGQSVYFAQETDIRQDRWLRLGNRVVTACTPLILFTGAGSRITGLTNRREHERLIATLRGLPTDKFAPESGPISRIVKRTRELSVRARAHFVRISNDARERALPFIERAYRSAQRGIHTMILKARPQP